MTRPSSEWKRTLWGLLGLLVVSGTAAAIWVHHVWSHSDQVLSQVVRDNLDRLAPGINVRFSSCRFDLLRRVRVDDVELSTPDGKPLATIPRITVAIDRQALAQHQQLVIQQVTLHQPQLHLARDAQGHWNWQDLDYGSLHSVESPLLPEWTVKQGRIELTLAGDPQPNRSLEHLELKLVPAGSDRYVLDAQAQLAAAGSSQPASALTLNGHWRVADHGLSIRGQLKDLSLDPQLLEFVTRLAPGGHADPATDSATDSAESGRLGTWVPQDLTAHAHAHLAFRVTRWQPDDDWDYRLLLRVQDGQLKLPLPPGTTSTLQQLAGQIYLDPRQLQIKNLKAHHGGTTVTLDGLVPRSNDPPAGHLDVSLKDLALDKQLRKILPPEWQRIFDVYGVSGPVDVTTSLRPTADGAWQPADSVLTARGCRVSHTRFPYPLEQVTGTLTQQGASRDLVVEIDAFAGDRPIQFRGRVQDAGPEASSQIDISVNRLPFDHQLLQAVSPAARKSLLALQLGGAADVRARLSRPKGPGRHVTTQLSGRLRNASVRFESFPWPIDKIDGEFTATIGPTGYAWRFEKLNGRHAEATISGSGQLDGQPRVPGRLELHLDAQHVALDEELRNACSLELGRLWDRVQPSGRFDGRIELRRDETGKVQVTIPRFAINAGTLQLKGFPYRLTNVRAAGNYGLTDDHQRRLTLNSFAAQHAKTRITTRGLLEIDDRKDWMLRLDPLACDELVADKDLLEALPGRLRQTVLHLNPQRPFHLSGLIELRGAGEPGFPITAAWNLETRLPDNRLSAGVQLEEVVGRITSRGKWYGQHAEMTGHFALDSASLWGYRFKDIRGPFQYRNQDLLIGSSQAFAPRRTRIDRLSIPLQERVTARAVGGLFTLDAQARIDQQSSYHVKMNMSEAKLEQFAKLYLRDPRKLKGVMRGWVDLRGTGNSPADITGRGKLQVSPAELYHLPIIVQLFDVLSLGPPQQTAFRYAQCDFELARSRIVFNSIDLVGNSLQLRGRGQATFDGRVGLDFYSMLPKSRLPIPFLQPLIAPLTTGWVAVRVDGKANQPRATIRPAPVLDDALRSFLGALEHPGGRRQPPPLNAPFGQRNRSLLPNSPAARRFDRSRTR